jgi:hypothetical protein
VYAAAQRYGAEGLPCIPLPAGKKFPPPEGWPKLATTDARQLKEWFDIDPFYGLPNIGMMTGELMRDGRRMFVLDVDPKHGGDVSLTKLEGEHGPLPATRSASTPSGGRHFLLAISAEVHVKNSVSGLGKGLDIRGYHGYIAVAPSTTDAGAYTWDDESAPIADAPRWLRDAITELRKSEPAQPIEEGKSGEVPSHGLMIDDARQMLTHLDAHVDDYQSWAEVLWALRRMARGAMDGSTLGDWLSLADEWSRRSKKYSGREVVESKWREADKTTGYGAAHLIELAKQGGWQPTDEQATRIGGRVASAEEFGAPVVTEPAVSLLPDAPKRAPLPLIAPPESLLTSIMPERDYALRPYFPRGTVSLLLSVGGLGKTNLMILLSVLKALGSMLPDCTLETPEAGRVVILTAEDDLSEMLRRLQRVLRLLKSQGVAIDMHKLRQNLQIADLTGGVDNLLVKADHSGAAPTDLAEHIAGEVGKADIIAIDTLSRFHGGSENDNTAGAALISTCELIARRTGSAVVVLAHTGKSAAREGPIDQYTGRGASSFSDNARSVLVLAAPSQEAVDTYEIDEIAAARGDIFRVAHVKSNYAKRAPDAYFMRAENGVVLPFIPKLKESPGDDALVLQLLTWIGKAEVRRNQMKDRFRDIFGNDMTKVRAWEIFDRAVRGGHLKFTRRLNNADYYVVDDLMKAAVDRPAPTAEPMSPASALV